MNVGDETTTTQMIIDLTKYTLLTLRYNSLMLRSRSLSYFTTDSQSVCLGTEHPCGTCITVLFIYEQLLRKLITGREIRSRRS
jgi:hypothetical protein